LIPGGEDRGSAPEPVGTRPAANPDPDETLIDAVLVGDASVSAELYDRLLPVVDGTLYRILGGRNFDHEDLVQSSFEQIVKTLTTRRFARSCSLRSWASSLTAHVALNALRSRVRERKVVDRSDAALDASQRRPASDDPERELQLKGEIERIRRELSSMSAQRAEALVLHDVLGHELGEIATLTGISVAAAQSRLVRARHELTERLGQSAPAAVIQDSATERPAGHRAAGKR
jgi:RNA polymerase sigma-70 factor (ECF subfamily)